MTIRGPRAVPQIVEVVTGRFDWSEVSLHLTPKQDAVEAFAAVLSGDAVARRDMLLRVCATGWVGLPQRMALEMAMRHASPEFAHFEFSDTDLVTECAAEDLDEIATGGALRMAAERLYEDTKMVGASSRDRRVADAALSRLYSFVRRQAQ